MLTNIYLQPSLPNNNLDQVSIMTTPRMTHNPDIAMLELHAHIFRGEIDTYRQLKFKNL